MTKEKAISLPFSIDQYGKVTSTDEQTKIWADRVRSVVGTTVKERVMRPEFGSTVAYKVFESQELAEQDIKTNIENAFDKQLPTLRLSSVDTSFDEYTGTINASVTYSLPNDTMITTTIGVVKILGNNPPVEEML